MASVDKTPCECGGELERVVGHNINPDKKTYTPYTVGWYCPGCKGFKKRKPPTKT